MSSTSFRPIVADEWHRVGSFLASIQNKPTSHEDYQDPWRTWKYFTPIPAWEHPSRSFVLERDGQLLAHGAAAPVTFDAAGKQLSGLQIVDWAGLPDAPGSGVALMREFMRLTDVFLTIGGSAETRAIVARYPGLQPAGDSRFYTRVTRPVSLAMRAGWEPRRWAKAGLSWAHQFGKPVAMPAGWKARRIRPAELPQALWRPVPVEGVASLVRTPEMFDYLLLRPGAKPMLYLLEHNGQPAGYCFMTLIQGQMRLMDVQSTSQETLRSAYAAAVSLADSDPETLEIATATNVEAHQNILAELGFRPRWPNPIHFLDRRKALNGLQPEVNMLVGDLHMFFYAPWPFYS